MTSVIGVNFNDSKKIYYFSLGDEDISKDNYAVVETERGLQCALVVTNVIEVDPSKLNSALKPVVRKATKGDIDTFNKNSKDAKKALDDAISIAKDLKLDMTIISASFTLDRKQLLFNFISDDRVDFRELAKKLAYIYKTRIELRQIGVRDKAKEVGGLGQCGRTLCCCNFLNDINSVSINMAKNQNLALNPQKINGACGRLMCCLSYENDNYAIYKKDLPKVGDKVKVGDEFGKVIYLDMFAKKYKVEMADGKVVDVEK